MSIFLAPHACSTRTMSFYDLYPLSFFIWPPRTRPAVYLLTFFFRNLLVFTLQVY